MHDCAGVKDMFICFMLADLLDGWMDGCDILFVLFPECLPGSAPSLSQPARTGQGHCL